MNRYCFSRVILHCIHNWPYLVISVTWPRFEPGPSWSRSSDFDQEVTQLVSPQLFPHLCINCQDLDLDPSFLSSEVLFAGAVQAAFPAQWHQSTPDLINENGLVFFGIGLHLLILDWKLKASCPSSSPSLISFFFCCYTTAAAAAAAAYQRQPVSRQHKERRTKSNKKPNSILKLSFLFLLLFEKKNPSVFSSSERRRRKNEWLPQKSSSSISFISFFSLILSHIFLWARRLSFHVRSLTLDLPGTIVASAAASC